ncbi:subtilisin-like protein [Aspergillus novofumigatus IBT 16806]|uniref:oryzin n=1 Tax=Aspergillus novofumigatus (strain IBT 16806) TaxID=1392255 RepID=A0A2I1CC12_ASPN1|nr:subtilisin-like protein [Aspergillus novofumigatus IBT 16806]PKX95126.1 subtilisin-like protein [Aspergillus novofumigatus IBT 16806]
MAPLWPWMGAFLAALPVALAGHGDPISQKYIVEFTDSETSSAGFLSTLNDHGIPASLNHDLSFALFHGGSFTLLDNKQNEAAIVKQISSWPVVKKVSPVRELHQPQRPVSSVAHGAPIRHSPVPHDLRRRDTTGQEGNDYPHIMTGVDKLRQEGYLGTGIRVAVIDSGVDYKHPALGGCFGKGCLVEFGFNFLDNTTDPWEGHSGHGTHVSGLIAAQPNPFNFTGVAPNVTLGHYKILGKRTVKLGTDLVAAAFKKAYEDKADIISASFGTYKGWSDEPWGQLIQKLAEAGLPSFIATGNDGNNGLFLASNGIDNAAGIGIGSFNNVYSPLLLPGASYSTGNTTKEFVWQLAGTSDFKNGTYSLYPSSLNASVIGDSCEPWTADHPNISNKIVLIRYGGCRNSVQQANAVKAGAKNILFYNNEPGTYELPVQNSALVGLGMVSAQTGENWVKLAASGANITLHMTSANNELLPVTAVSGVGGFMLSTWPLLEGGYAVDSGTSMATPYVAGCVALLMEARGKGKVTPAEIKSLLSTTAKPNVFHDGVTASPFLASVAQQGGGLIDAYKLVHTTTKFNVSTIAFNDTEHLAPAWIRINNTGSEPRVYTVGHVVAATVYTLSDNSSIPQRNRLGHFVDRTTEGASLKFSSSVVLVAPGESAVLKVTATPPKGVIARRIPVYSGYVTFNGTSADDSFSVPYLGVATAMRNVTILDTTQGGNYIIDSTTQKRVQANHQFVLPGKNGPPPAQTPATPSSRPSSQWERICSSSVSNRQTAALSSQCLIP